MDNDMEPWEREWREWLYTAGTDKEIAFVNRMSEEERSNDIILSGVSALAAHLRQQARIDKLRAILQELRDFAESWSEYDLPVGIVERMDAVLADHVRDTTKKEQP